MFQLKIRPTLVAGLLTLASLTSSALASDEQVLGSAKLEKLAGDRTVAFVAVDLKTGARHGLGGDLLDERRSPWSSFKIPNMVIALETKVSANADAKREWDRERHPQQGYWPPVWKKSHTLESAFQNSVIWYFKDIAADVGTERYLDYLATFSYGNQEVPEESNDFWLGGDLKISPREQVDFLAALRQGGFDIADNTLAALEQASLIASQEGYALHAKSGAGRVKSGASKGRLEGWYVGWVDGPQDQDTVFALFTEGKNYQAIKKFRRQFSEKALMEIGALPSNWTAK